MDERCTVGEAVNVDNVEEEEEEVTCWNEENARAGLEP
jgi:hypothetical protein